MKHKKIKKGSYSILFKELERLKLGLKIDFQEIKTSELEEIDNMRKAVIEVSTKPYIYCSTT